MTIGVPRSGITIGNTVYEWIQAAHFDSISFDDFLQKPREYKERIIAAMRLAQQTEAVIAKAMRPKKRHK